MGVMVTGHTFVVTVDLFLLPPLGYPTLKLAQAADVSNVGIQNPSRVPHYATVISMKFACTEDTLSILGPKLVSLKLEFHLTKFWEIHTTRVLPLGCIP
jgi:hypothetical protein